MKKNNKRRSTAEIIASATLLLIGHFAVSYIAVAVGAVIIEVTPWTGKAPENDHFFLAGVAIVFGYIYAIYGVYISVRLATEE